MKVMAWQKARDAAWREFGRRYWRVIVGLEIARRSAPAVAAGLAVAGLAVLVWWLVTHAPSPSSVKFSRLDVPGRWWWWLIGVLGAIMLFGWVRHRNPYMPPQTGRRAAVAVLAFVAATVAFLVWRSA